MDPGLSNSTAYVVTIAINGDDAENVRPKPKSGDGEYMKVVFLPKNNLLKRLDATVAEEHWTGCQSLFLCSGNETCKHGAIWISLPEMLRAKGSVYVFVSETTGPPLLRLCIQLNVNLK